MKKLNMHSWHRLKPVTMKVSMIFSLLAVIRIFNIESTKVPYTFEDSFCEFEEVDMIQQKNYTNKTTIFTIPENIKDISPLLFEEKIEALPINNSMDPEKPDSDDFIPLPDNSFRLPVPIEEEGIEEYKPELYLDFVEEMPVFESCDSVFDNYEEKLKCTQSKITETILKNLRYPRLAIHENIEGIVVAEIIVDTSGVISSISIPRPIGFGMDESVITTMQKLPAWKPGRQNDRKVPVRMFIPVKFKLQDY